MHAAIRAALWIVAGIIVLVAGLFLYLRSADLSTYQGPVEEALSDALGHELRIDGQFELEFGGQTRLTADAISVSNVDWQPEPVLLEVGRFSVTLDTWSVVRGPVIIQSLEISDVVLRVAVDEDQRSNWDTGRPAETSSGGDEFDAERVLFRNLSVANVDISLTDPSRRRPLVVGIDALTIDPDEDRVLDLDLTARINEFPLLADGRIGPWENLLTGRNLKSDLTVTLGQTELVVDGFVEDLRALEGVDLSLDLAGPAIDRVAEVLGLPPFAEGPFQLAARAQKTDEENLVRLSGNLGDIDVNLDGVVDRLLDPGSSAVEFRISGPNIRYVAELFGVMNAREAPFILGGGLRQDGSRLHFTDTEMQLADSRFGAEGWIDTRQAFPDLDLNIQASGSDLSVIGPFASIDQIPAEPFQADGNVNKLGDAWRFRGFLIEVGENSFSVDGAIDPDDDAASEIRFSAAGPDISFLQPMTGLEGLPERPFDISGRIGRDPVGVIVREGTAVFGDNKVGLNGIIGIADGLNGTRIEFMAAGPELTNVAMLTGVPYLPAGPFDVSAKLEIDSDELIIESANANVTGVSASVNGSVGLASNAGQFNLDISAAGDDIAGLLRLEGLQRLAGQSFDVSGRVAQTERGYEFDNVVATIDNLEATVDGELGLDGRTVDLSFRADAPDAGLVATMLTLQDLPDRPVSVGGRIEREDDEFRITDLEARIGLLELAADGTLSMDPLSNDSDFRFSINGPELRRVGVPFGVSVLPAREFSLAGEVNGVPSGFVIENVIARVGENDISGRFAADLSDKSELTGTVSATFLDLKTPMEESTAEDLAEAPEDDREFLLSDDPLPIDWLDAMNVDVDLEFGRLILSQAEMQDFDIGVRLWDGVLDIDPIRFNESDGTLSARLRLDAVEEALRLELNIAAEGLHLGLLAGEDQDRSSLPPFDGTIDLEGTGSSVHRLMAGANGDISMRQGAGRVRDMVTSRLFGDLMLQVIRTLNPMREAEPYMSLECAFYDISIENGLATIDNVALQSDKLTILTRGDVNFADESLNLSLRATPREGIGISIGGVANSFLKLGGTLLSPRLEIDPTATMTTGGVAVATGGLSLLAKGLWDRMSAASGICENGEPPAQN